MVHDLDSLGHHLDQEVFSGSVGIERLPLRLPAGRFLRLVVHEAGTSEQVHVPGLVRQGTGPWSGRAGRPSHRA